jgi:hypothetical protein
MKQPRQLFFAIVAVALAALGLVLLSHRHEVTGAWKAYRDIGAGQLEIKIVGFPLPYDTEYRRLLLSRYGISSVNLGCDPGSPEARQVLGYNWVSSRAIRRKFGRDVATELLNEVRQEWKARHAKPGVV